MWQVVIRIFFLIGIIIGFIMAGMMDNNVKVPAIMYWLFAIPWSIAVGYLLILFLLALPSFFEKIKITIFMIKLFIANIYQKITSASRSGRLVMLAIFA